MALPTGAPLDARFELGNSSSARKRISVLLIESDFSDISVCTFWVPPNTPLTPYRMRSHTTKAWSNAAIYFYAATAGTDGGFNLIDNVSLAFNSTYAGDRTECVDPFAPQAGTDPDGPDLLVNGDFETGDTTGWTVFGTITPNVSGGVFQFMRESSAAPAGAILQPTGQALAAHDVLTATFDMGNTSSVRKRVTVLLHDFDFTDLSACTFWLAPGQPRASFSMRAYATRPWANATLSFYAATVDSQAWTQLDNVHLHRTPSAAVTGVECVEPADWSISAAALGTTTSSQGQTTAGSAPNVSAASASLPGSSPAALGSTAIELPAPTGALVPRTSKAPIIATIVPMDGLDLTSAQTARLDLESWLRGSTSGGELNVSLDGLNWIPVAAIRSSEDWSSVSIDLSTWTGQFVFLRFVLYNDADQSTDWLLKNVAAIIGR